MTLDEFLAGERERLVAFEAYWRRMMFERPDLFRNEHEPSDWDEGLQTFDPDDAEPTGKQEGQGPRAPTPEAPLTSTTSRTRCKRPAWDV